MATLKIRPGILVALKSTLNGGVRYQRIDLDHRTESDGRDVSRWETLKEIEDPIEHERATKARNKARAEISRVCSATSFGLLCPVTDEGILDAAIQRARTIVEEHNATATFSRIGIYALKGQIAATDEEAARAIGEEVSDLINGMGRAIDALDPVKIREAAGKARELATMLGDEQRVTVDAAIEAARKAARQIVKRIEKGGETAAIVLADIQRGDLEKARIAFLDLDGDRTPSESLPALPVQRFVDLDLFDGKDS
jgi:hypothetical protein